LKEEREEESQRMVRKAGRHQVDEEELGKEQDRESVVKEEEDDSL